MNLHDEGDRLASNQLLRAQILQRSQRRRFLIIVAGVTCAAAACVWWFRTPAETEFKPTPKFTPQLIQEPRDRTDLIPFPQKKPVELLPPPEKKGATGI